MISGTNSGIYSTYIDPALGLVDCDKCSVGPMNGQTSPIFTMDAKKFKSNFNNRMINKYERWALFEIDGPDIISFEYYFLRDIKYSMSNGDMEHKGPS